MANHEILSSAKTKKSWYFYGYNVVIGGFLGVMVAFGTMYSFGVFFKPAY